MVRGVSQVFVAGPPVVARAFGAPVGKEELGGVDIHGEQRHRRQRRRLRGGGLRADPPVPGIPAGERLAAAAARDARPTIPRRRDEALLSIIPQNRRRGYDPRTLVGHVVDRDSFFELGRTWGGSLVTALARLDGYPVGVVASRPDAVAAAALTADGSDKLARVRRPRATRSICPWCTSSTSRAS